MAKYAPKRGKALADRVKTWIGDRAYSNMCQAWVVTMAGTGAVGDFDGDGAADAEDGWRKAVARGRVVLANEIKSYKDIPAGVPLYWVGGSRDYGHTCISIGGGEMVSTDAGPRWGVIGRRGIGYISAYWRNGLTFVGYALQEGNGYTFIDEASKPAPPKPKPATYYVNTARAYAHDKPDVDSKVVGTLGEGAQLQVVAVEEHNGGVWGYTILDGKKRWWIMRLLSKTKPNDKKLEARIGQLNSPGYDKGLGNEDARARKIAKEANDRRLDAFNLNEGESRRSATQPSKWVALILKYLGPEWDVIVPSGDPTSGSNENYTFFRKEKFPSHVKHPDFVVRAGYGGRHLTPTTFTDAVTGKPLTIGATHLAPGRKAGPVQGPVVAKHLKQLADGGLWVLSGDMNTEVTIAPKGALNPRLVAKATSNVKMSTYGRYTDTEPTYKPEWIIDQFAVDDRFQVDGYTVVPDTNADGEYNEPRIGDHLFVIIKVTEL